MSSASKRQAAGVLVGKAGRIEARARTADSEAERLRLRGDALILRGSAWRLYAEAMR